MSAKISVVVPTVGRPSLSVLLAAVTGRGCADEILVVDDRRTPDPPLVIAPGVRLIRGPGRGPAAARNCGWQAAAGEWIAFLDDDVVPAANWSSVLRQDLLMAPASVGAVQGRLAVPLPADRRPTDWERCTSALAQGRWITADISYRRTALAAVGGFDERFPAAYREDAELAHRVRMAGWTLVRGARQAAHPVRPEGPWVSVRAQRGNADDALLRRLYGPRWRSALELPTGRRGNHVVICVAGALAVIAGLGSRRGTQVWTQMAALAAGLWAGGVAQFASARIRPGPRTATEVVTMAVTSAIIPQVAVSHWLHGWWRSRGAKPLMPVPPHRSAPSPSAGDGALAGAR
ncbi:glycosyltransferase family 2 protein [Pilimelia columellifera]|uniref:4,4'-diaponeurosporenoate glycosyltransferase n=1 Tax=Pilimelia columellifera subsp. columellifera TaxID=706583 RepID=A0ABP6ALS0_9ACTN